MKGEPIQTNILSVNIIPICCFRKGNGLFSYENKPFTMPFCGDEPFQTIDIEESDGPGPSDYPAAMTAEEVFGCCRGN